MKPAGSSNEHPQVVLGSWQSKYPNGKKEERMVEQEFFRDVDVSSLEAISVLGLECCVKFLVST